MIGSFTDSALFGMPDVKRQNELSEEEQAEIIQRALYGDLKGLIPVTQEDIDLYNRVKYKGTETYANEYRKATEFSYVPRHKQEQVKKERAEKMGLIQPPQGNPVLSGYQSFSSPYQPIYQYQYQPQYQYPNTYYSYMGYDRYSSPYSYYGYGYNPYYQNQPDVDFGDPVTNYAFSRINQLSSPYQSYYSGYQYYNAPRNTQFTVNSNMQPSDMLYQYIQSTPDTMMVQESNIRKEYVYPPGFDDEPVVITIKPEMKRIVDQYNYYNPPPYARTEQFKRYVAQQQQERKSFMETLNRMFFGDEEYQKMVDEQTRRNNEIAANNYKRRHMYDSKLAGTLNSPQEKFKIEIEENMRRVINFFNCNPYYIQSFKLHEKWEDINNRILNSKPMQAIRKFFKPTSTFVEFMNEEYPKYKANKDYEDFCRKARISLMEYDADKYRNALYRSGISSTPYLGFKSAYDPVSKSQVNVSSAPQSIAERYNERRNSYIREAEKRGSVV